MNVISRKYSSQRIHKFITGTTLLCFFVLVPMLPAGEGGLGGTDPMIKISSLPTKLDLKAVLAKVGDDVSRDTGLDKNMVSYYWQTLDCIYAPGASSVGIEGDVVFIDIYVPGFMTDEDIGKVMTSLAVSLEKNAGINRKALFIYTHVCELKRLYMMGEIITDWSQVGGPASDKSVAGE
jgi:hypothetical protein